jgi:hypothetical protein
LDKDGPICAEQILLWKATKCMDALSQAVGTKLSRICDADALREKIYSLYYRDELGGFIDSFTSGKNVEQTERDAKRLFPPHKWHDLHLQMIYYGREYSPARGLDLSKDIITSTIVGEKALKSTSRKSK